MKEVVITRKTRMENFVTTRYQCEKCGAMYADKESAKKCELAHMDPIRVFEFKYRKGQVYPECITVGMGSGAQMQYYLAREDNKEAKA